MGGRERGRGVGDVSEDEARCEWLWGGCFLAEDGESGFGGGSFWHRQERVDSERVLGCREWCILALSGTSGFGGGPFWHCLERVVLLLTFDGADCLERVRRSCLRIRCDPYWDLSVCFVPGPVLSVTSWYESVSV